MKLCTVCGVVTSRPGSRCLEHARQSNRSRHNALYSTRAWQRLSARVLRAWRGQHGNWCPGYGRAAHRASDLTVDHVVPLAAGGAPFDVANTGVLCRSCNSTKGASEPVSVARVASVGIVVDADRGGVPHMPTPTLPDAWLVEAQQFPSLEDHVRSIAALPVEAAPLSVIGERVEAAVRASMKGQPRDAVERAVRRAVRDEVFLLTLALGLNFVALETARVVRVCAPRPSSSGWAACWGTTRKRPFAGGGRDVPTRACRRVGALVARRRSAEPRGPGRERSPGDARAAVLRWPRRPLRGRQRCVDESRRVRRAPGEPRRRHGFGRRADGPVAPVRPNRGGWVTDRARRGAGREAGRRCSGASLRDPGRSPAGRGDHGAPTSGGLNVQFADSRRHDDLIVALA